MALQGTGSRVNGWSRSLPLTGVNYPITLSAWIKLPAGSNTASSFFGLCGANALAWMLFYGTNLTGGFDDVIFDLYDDTGFEAGGAHPVPGRGIAFPSDGNWHHVGFKLISNLSPPPGANGGLLWIDGVQVGTAPAGFNLGAQTFTTLQIGVAPSDGLEPIFDIGTALAEVCVFRSGPGTPEADSMMKLLAQGASPLKIPGKQGLLAYHPLRGNFQDFGPQRNGFGPIGTPIDPIWVPHPPVDPAPIQFRRLPATHAPAAFAGTAASADSASGVLTTGVILSGTGSSADGSAVNLLASSLLGITQPTTDTATGFLTSTPSMIGTSTSSNNAAGAFSPTQIPLISTGAASSDSAIGSLTIPSIAANCQQLQNALVDSIMRGQPFQAPGTWFIALVTQLGDTVTPGIEVTGGSYARSAADVSLAAWSGTQGQGTVQQSSGTSGLVSNNAPIAFPPATTDWGTVVGYEFWDQPSGGNRWIAGKLGTAVTIHSGDIRQFPAGSLSVAMG